MDISRQNEPESVNEPELTTVQPNRRSAYTRWWLWLGLAALTVVVIGTALMIKRLASDTAPGEDAPSARRSSEHSPGSEVTIYLQGRNSVMVAADEATLDDLVAALAAKGEEVEKLVQSGRVFTVPNNTRVRIVEASFAKLKVRIIEGKKIMTEVWIPERWVR